MNIKGYYNLKVIYPLKVQMPHVDMRVCRHVSLLNGWTDFETVFKMYEMRYHNLLCKCMFSV